MSYYYKKLKLIHKIILFLIILYIPQQVHSISYLIHAFNSYTDPTIRKMELIGQISSKTKRSSKLRRKLLNYDSRETMITVKLFKKEGLKLGDVIYIIAKDPDHRKYKNGLIVAKGKVFSIFKTEFQGWMLKASGNFAMVKKSQFIAIVKNDIGRRKALFAFKKAERYFYLKQYSKAYAFYRKALKYQDQNPEIFFSLARLKLSQGLYQEAQIYIKKAWKFLYRFEDVNNVLRLPGVYLKLMTTNIKLQKTKNSELKFIIQLIDDSREYFKKLSWFQTSIDKNVFNMIRKKGLPDTEFQFQLALLYEKMYNIIKNKSPSKILRYLNKKERTVFLAMIPLPYMKEKKVFPKKSWDEAFIKAAIYHYQLAHELNSLDVRSAYKLSLLSYEKSKISISRQDKEAYILLTKKYIQDFLRVKTGYLKMSRKERTQIYRMKRRIKQIQRERLYLGD